jgi:CheY-like chemotaxis protein
MNTALLGPSGLASQVTVLSVAPNEEDHGPLKTIFENFEWNLCPNSKWNLIARPTVESAIALLRRHRISVVLCAHHLMPGTWRDLLDELQKLPSPPALIVTSRVADEGLWAEALNLGAYDVLAQPFDASEVVRVVGLAWLNRNSPPQSAAGAPFWGGDVRPAIAPRGPLSTWSVSASGPGGSNALRHAV